MENPVYDKVARILSTIVSLGAFVPLIIAFLALRLLVQKAADERLIVATAAAFLLVSIASLFVLFRLDTNDWISIDPIQRKVFRIYELFGCSVYRKVYDLSQFDRISLHRVPRGGYRATLVGREQEVVLSVSWIGFARRLNRQLPPLDFK